MKTFLQITSALSLTALLITVLLVILKLGTWASELSELLLAWTVMLGGALAYIENSHLGLDILVEKFDHYTRRIALTLSHTIILLFATTVLIYGGSNLTLERLDMGQIMPALNIPKAYLYLSLPIAGTFITLTALKNLFTIFNQPTCDKKCP